MPDQPGKRKAEQASWEQYSEIIEELFITGGKTMEDIRKILSEEYGLIEGSLFMVVEVNSTLKRVTQDGAARTCNKANENKEKP